MWVVGLAPIVFILYVLSAAPVAASMNNVAQWQVDLYFRFYAPVIWLEHTPLATPLRMYWNLWNPPPPAHLIGPSAWLDRSDQGTLANHLRNVAAR